MNETIKKLIKGSIYEKQEVDALIVKLIRKRYSINDEIAIIRQASTKSDEFNAYNEYVEQCKKQAKEQFK